MNSKHRGGFTLVELLVVLVILVAILGLVGPRILGAQAKADIKKTQIDIGNLEGALELYHVDNRTFPLTEEGLNALLEKPADEIRGRAWDGPYLDAEDLPMDPWGNTYQYLYPPTHGKRDFPNLWSPGKDRQENTDDDVFNWKADDSESSSQPANTNG